MAGPALLLALLALSATPQLGWEAPLACPDASWLEARVEAYLGRELRAEEREDAPRARVREDDGEFVLELRRAGETRTLRHHDCARLVEIAASLTAIALDPLAGLELPAPATPTGDWRGASASPRARDPAVLVQRPRTRARPPAPRSTAVAPEAPAEPAPPVAPPPRSDWALEPIAAGPEADRAPEPEPSSRRRRAPGLRALVLADAGLALGLFPNPAPQVHGSIGLDIQPPSSRRWAGHVELEGGAVLAGRFRVGDAAAEVGGDLTAWELGLRPCAVPRWGIVDLRLCAGVGAGQVRGRGVGVQDPQLGTQPWVWADTQLGVAVALVERVALFADLGASYNLLRPRFIVESPAAEWVVPTLGGRARLGLELRFGER